MPRERTNTEECPFLFHIHIEPGLMALLYKAARGPECFYYVVLLCRCPQDVFAFQGFLESEFCFFRMLPCTGTDLEARKSSTYLCKLVESLHGQVLSFTYLAHYSLHLMQAGQLQGPRGAPTEPTIKRVVGLVQMQASRK